MACQVKGRGFKSRHSRFYILPIFIQQSGAVVARQVHILKVAGLNPASAILFSKTSVAQRQSRILLRSRLMVRIHPLVLHFLWGVRLSVRTSGFHPEKRGSIPLHPFKFNLRDHSSTGEQFLCTEKVVSSNLTGSIF